MANTILLKKSGTASVVPSSLSFGELALNYADGKLYYKNVDTTIKEIMGTSAGTGTVTSVGIAAPAIFTITNSPITAAGTLTLSYSGTALPVANGGTGLIAIAARSIPVANSANVYTTITPAAGQSIRINAGNTAWEAYTPGTGTVSTISIASSNGFTGTVATATTTPVVTLATSINGIIKGNSIALSAAVAGTDYVSPSVSTNFTAPQRPSISAELAPTANALTWDLTTTSILRVNLNAPISTLTLSGTLSNYAGYQYQMVVRYNGGTSISWPTTVKFTSSILPTLTGTSGRIDVFNFVIASNNGGSTFYLLCTGISQNL